MNNLIQMLIVAGILSLIISIGILIWIEEIKEEKEFYKQRQFFRENWDCEIIQTMLYPTGKWGEGERTYLNSLWIVKECWK